MVKFRGFTFHGNKKVCSSRDGTKTIRIAALGTVNPNGRLSMEEFGGAIMKGTIFHLSFVVKFQSISFLFRLKFAYFRQKCLIPGKFNVVRFAGTY